MSTLRPPSPPPAICASGALHIRCAGVHLVHSRYYVQPDLSLIANWTGFLISPPPLLPPPLPPPHSPPLDWEVAVQEAAVLIGEIVRVQHCGPLLIRLAWHDAGTFIAATGQYGPRASMRFSPERDDPANKGLDRARALLEPVKAAVPLLSYADLWQLGAVVSTQLMGGPRIPFRAGRIDATSAAQAAPNGLLPAAHGDAAHLREIFYRMGFADAQIVALSGAHSVGRCHLDVSGFEGAWTKEHLTFDNGYFKDLTTKTWAPPHPPAPRPLARCPD